MTTTTEDRLEQQLWTIATRLPYWSAEAVYAHTERMPTDFLRAITLYHRDLFRADLKNIKIISEKQRRWALSASQEQLEAMMRDVVAEVAELIREDQRGKQRD